MPVRLIGESVKLRTDDGRLLVIMTVAGQVGRVGGPPSWLLAGMNLDQLPAAVQLDQRRVGAGI